MPTPCGRCKVLRDQLYTAGDELDRAIETRENANAVSVRIERERDRYLRMFHELIAIAGRPGDGGLFNATMQVRDRLNAEREEL